MPLPSVHRIVAATAALALFATTGCPARRDGAGALPAAGSRPASTPAAAKAASPDRLYELSPARVQVRRLAVQALRLLAPHWSSVRKSDRRVLQATLVETVSEERVAPFVKLRLAKAAAESPELAAAAADWLAGADGYAVKFAEATALRGERSPDAAFYQQIADVRAERTPAVRLDRVHALEEATRSLERTLDVTEAVGTVVARLVNVARPHTDPVALAALEAAIDAERASAEVPRAYAPVVTAAVLLRTGDLGLEELDRYVEFSRSEAGAWYHDAMTAALVGAVADAAMDVEGVFDANAHSDRAAPVTGGFDLDALVVTLASGRDVRLLNLAQTGPPDGSSVVLRYESTLPIGDAASVGREAGEVWSEVRSHIEAGGATAAVLQATGSVEGWVFPFASSRKYSWKRDGASWVAASAADAPLERELLWSLPP